MTDEPTSSGTAARTKPLSRVHVAPGAFGPIAVCGVHALALVGTTLWCADQLTIHSGMPRLSSTLLAGSVLLVALTSLGVACSSSGSSRPFAVGARRAALVTCPIALLSILEWFGWENAVLRLSALLLSLYALDAQVDLRGERARRAWAVALAAVTIGISFCYLHIASMANGNADNDAAYYFGVARQMVESRTFQEPIVWQFLAGAKTVVHPAFDYWQPLTSLVLLPSMTVFGASHRVALVTMGVISVASLFLFWWLVSMVLRLRSPTAQFAALIAFAFGPAMMTFRFDTESAPVAHLVMLGALVALAKRRPVVTVALASLLVVTRTDLVWVAGILALGSLHCAFSLRSSDRFGPPLRVVGTLFAMAAGYLLVSWCRFGSAIPPGIAAAGTLNTYLGLYEYPYISQTQSTWQLWGQRDVDVHAVLALRTLAEAKLASPASLWLMLVLGCGLVGQFHRMRTVSWGIVFVGSFLMALTGATVFAPQRSLHSLAPAFALAGAFALNSIAGSVVGGEGVLRWLRRLVVAAVGACVLAYTLPYPQRTNPMAPMEEGLRQIDTVLAGAPVAARRPWYVIANTSSPAISIPSNGEAAVAQALTDYRIRWLLLTRESCRGASQGFCNEILSGRRRTIGSLRLQPTARHGDMQLFDIGH